MRTDSWPPWPRCAESTERAAVDALRSGRWALTGPSTGCDSYNRQFEDAFAAYNGVAHCVAVASGSAALRVSLQSLDVGLGDEVLVPGLTWVACASAVLGVGAIPVLVDVDPGSLCMDLDAARAAVTTRTRAIMLVHAYCSVADIMGFVDLARATDIPLLEDCSQAHGAVYAGQRVGSFGTLGAFSMQQTKVLTSGEGGAVVTADYAHYRRLQELRADGRRYVDRPARGALDLCESGSVQGQNCAMSELHCALLIDQLQHLNAENVVRAGNAAYLDARLRETGAARPLTRNRLCADITYYKYCFRVDRRAFMGAHAAVIANALRAELNLDVSQVHPPIHRSPLYQPLRHGIHSRVRAFHGRLDPGACELPEAARAWDECVAIPHEALLGSPSDMEDIARAVAKVLQHASTLPTVAAVA